MVAEFTNERKNRVFHCDVLRVYEQVVFLSRLHNLASEASPTLGCSIEISRDICIYVCVSVVVQKA